VTTSAPDDSEVLYICGSAADLDQLTKYLSNATATAPFNVNAVLARLTWAVTGARTRNAGVLRIPLPTMRADALKAWLEKDVLRLAEAGYVTMSALLQRISFER
jgi:hypothetical protein